MRENRGGGGEKKLGEGEGGNWLRGKIGRINGMEKWGEKIATGPRWAANLKKINCLFS